MFIAKRYNEPFVGADVFLDMRSYGSGLETAICCAIFGPRILVLIKFLPVGLPGSAFALVI